MSNKTIQCPKCKAEIEISEVLSQQIEKDLKKQYQQAAREEIELAEKRAIETATEKSRLEVLDLHSRLEENQNRLIVAEERELELRKKERKLKEQKRQQQEKIDKAVKKQKKQLIKDIRQQEEERQLLQIKALNAELESSQKKVEESALRELDVLKEKRELQTRQKELELEQQRKLDVERSEIEKKAVEQYSQESELRILEKEKQIEGLRKSLEEARRKSQQSSMEIQGEVFEDELENKLAREFVQDEFSAVKKGARGADIIQTVRDASLNACGTIIWEAKNTKNWQPAWLEKLKDDQRLAGANVGVIVSTVLPSNITSFCMQDGIWITSIEASLPLASALREMLINVSYARNSAQGKNEKMDLMYHYFSGDEFRQKVEGIVEAFTAMQNQLNRERRAMERLWKEREKQIQRIMTNTTGMYGDVRGIVGSSVQGISALELDGLLLEGEE